MSCISRPATSRSLLASALVALSSSLALAASQEDSAPPSGDRIVAMPEKHFTFFEKYCIDCHDDVSEEGGLNLYDLPFELVTLQSAETWQKVLNSINSGEMPPKKKQQPSDEDKTAFLQDLSQQLVAARELLSDTGGEITMRRLNRREYENTIETLLGVRIEAEDLPSDENPGGFDTAGGSLFFSSDQFEQYLHIAQRALDEAFVSANPPKPKKVRVEAEVAATKQATNRLTNLQKSWDRAQAWRASDKDPTEFGFIDSARVKFEEGVYKRQAPSLKAYLSWPESETGAVLHTQFGGAYISPAQIPAKAADGDYLLRFRVAVMKEDVAWPRRFIEYGTTASGAQGGEIEVAGCVHVKGTLAEPQIIEVPITLSRGQPRTWGLRERQVNNRDFMRQQFTAARAKDKPLPDPALWIDWIEWEGPLPSKRAEPTALAHLPKPSKGTLEDAEIRQALTNFATVAFRQKAPSKAFLDKLMALYHSELELGKKGAEATKLPVAVILSSPSFLYLAEPIERKWIEKSGKPQPKRVALSNREFAIRLAYFLWSSPPDEELLELAMAGELKKSEVLRAQTERLLGDPRAWEFITGFTHQWLHMERLDFFNFNFRRYPTFDESVKESARQEVYHTIATVLEEENPIGDLLDPDYLVVNDVLRNYYQLGGLQGGEKGTAFAKTPIPDGSPRGGLLGMAAILAMGSDGERTSPVERGAWIMRKLIHQPPPPAPPNVPQLSRNAREPISARQLLMMHNEASQCAQCHQRIDPIGFGLEHFDAAGLWREKELAEVVEGRRVVKRKHHEIDDSGTLPDGTTFADFFELRDRIAEREEAFARGFTEYLIEYGLGRPFGFSDLNLSDQVLAEGRKNGFAMKAFIHGLVQSRAFRLK